MNEIIDHAIRMVNLPFTVMLGLVVIYWLLVMVGALDMDLFDVETHMDGMDHGDSGQHVEGGHDAHREIGFFTKVMHFAGVGEVPVTFILSVMSLCMWMCSMAAHYYIQSSLSPGLLAFALLAPNLIVSLIATRFLVLPFRPMFRVLMKDRDPGEAVLGNFCKITSTTADNEFGQAEITTKGSPVIINVRTINDAVIHKGETATVVREDREKGIFYIAEMPPASNNNTTSQT